MRERPRPRRAMVAVGLPAPSRRGRGRNRRCRRRILPRINHSAWVHRRRRRHRRTRPVPVALPLACPPAPPPRRARLALSEREHDRRAVVDAAIASCAVADVVGQRLAFLEREPGLGQDAVERWVPVATFASAVEIFFT